MNGAIGAASDHVGNPVWSDCLDCAAEKPLIRGLSLAQFDELHRLTDGRGRAKIERALLSRLLIDHSRLLNAVKAAGATIAGEA